MSGLVKRSFSLAGHATSVALEPEFWAVLDQMAKAAGLSRAAFMAGIDARRGRRPLASSCRVLALAWVRDHSAAGGAAGAGASGMSGVGMSGSAGASIETSMSASGASGVGARPE